MEQPIKWEEAKKNLLLNYEKYPKMIDTLFDTAYLSGLDDGKADRLSALQEVREFVEKVDFSSDFVGTKDLLLFLDKLKGGDN